MGHFYKRDGTAAHFLGPSGGPTTLREARKLGLLPSVTEVLQIISRPQLEAWKREQSVLSALTLQRLPDEPEKEFLQRIAVDASQQAQKAADAGVAVHDALEASFNGEAIPERHRATVDAVREKLSDLFPKVTDWVAEQSFAHPSGYGGKCDLHSPSTGIVCDWKGKDGDFTDGKRLAYEQHYQLAAYQAGLGLPAAPAVNIFFSRTHPGAVAAYLWEAPDMEKGWAVFCAALQLHKALKNYDGGWS